MKTNTRVYPLGICCWFIMTSGIDCGPVDPPYCELPESSLDFGVVEIGQNDEQLHLVNVVAPNEKWENEYESVFQRPPPTMELRGNGLNCDEFTVLDGSRYSVSSHEVRGNAHLYKLDLDGYGEHRLTMRFVPKDVGNRTCTFSTEVVKRVWAGDYVAPCGDIALSGEGREPVGPPKSADWYECTATPMPSANFRGVWASSETDIHVVGDDGAAFHYTGGCEWQQMGPGFADVDLTDVWGSASDDVWIVGNSDPEIGNVFHYDGSGWSLAQSDGFVTFDAVWGSSSCDVYFGGLGISTDFPNAKHYDCAQFDTLVIDMGWDPITGVWGTAKDNIWVVMRQAGYSIWQGDKSGWTNETPAFADQRLHDVWVAPTGEVFAVGEGGTIYFHGSGGWVEQTIAGAGHFYGVWGTSATNVMAVGQGGMIHQYDGNAWAPMEVPAAVTSDLRAIYGISEEVAFAVGDGGKILFYGEQP